MNPEEQLTLYDEVDMDGKDCEVCDNGTYQIADLNDEIHGERHCNKCGHFVNRYKKVW
jgi:hypothetical protein